MATVVIPNCVQIAVEANCSGQPVVNVLHFKYDAGFTLDAGAALGAFKTAWEKTGGPLKLKSSLVTMVGYKLTDLNSTDGVTSYLASGTAGAAAATLSTMASSALVKMGGGTRSRSGSGRLYHGPLVETNVNPDGRTLNSTFGTGILTAYNQLKTDMSAVSLQWCVASRKNLSTSVISNLSVSPIIATQRRRLR